MLSEDLGVSKLTWFAKEGEGKTNKTQQHKM